MNRILSISVSKPLASMLCILWISSCVPLDQTTTNVNNQSQPKKLQFENLVYEQNIKTVRLYPIQNSYDEVIQPAILPIQSQRNLILEFDQLFGDFESFYARLIHCDANWEKSQLRDSEVLTQFNEFPITEYQYSFGTRTPYVHYEWIVPHVKRTGNYLIKVFRQGNESDLILTRRFMVYDNKIQIEATVGISQGIVERDFNQQLNFSIRYPDLQIQNPLEEINVVIRQNKRWDTVCMLSDVNETQIISITISWQGGFHINHDLIIDSFHLEISYCERRMTMTNL